MKDKFKEGDLVELVFDKKLMQHQRYGQEENKFVDGRGCVISGPYEVIITPAHNKKTYSYEVFFQNNQRSCKIPQDLLKKI